MLLIDVERNDSDVEDEGGDELLLVVNSHEAHLLLVEDNHFELVEDNQLQEVLERQLLVVLQLQAHTLDYQLFKNFKSFFCCCSSHEYL